MALRLPTHRMVGLMLFWLATIASLNADEYFWHITDLHYDPSYSSTQDSCNDVIPPDKLGQYGDYECDSPWRLVESSVQAMHQFGPVPKFIIWTGDAPPHPKNASSMSEPQVIEILANTTRLIRETFPGVPVYATLGNHDYYPQSQMPAHECLLYNVTATELWTDWLGSQMNIDTFARGAFYTRPMPEVGPRVRAVIVNTNLYYTQNAQIPPGLPDPASQFVWLNETLSQARQNEEKVHVITHIPPGVLEGEDARWFGPAYNERFLDVLLANADVILGVYAGHQHSDSFRVLYDRAGTATVTLLVTPSVTPWKARLPGGVRGPARNPGIRRIFYDEQSHALSDLEQYYLPLNSTTGSEPVWTRLYGFKSAYSVPDLSPGSLHDLIQRFKQSSNSALFQQYYLHNSVRAPQSACTDCACTYAHVCALQYARYEEHEACVRNAPCAASKHWAGYQSGIAVALVVIFWLRQDQISH